MLRLAINGFGRIGRNVLRALYESGAREHIQIVAINEIAAPEGVAHLLKYDTAHGRFKWPVSIDGECLKVANDTIALMQVENLDSLNWHAFDVDIVHLFLPEQPFSTSNH